MNIEEIREYLIDFQKKELPHLIEREMFVVETKKIKSLIGPRRAGKTFFMYQKIEELIKKGTEKENILYLNFEDPRLMDIQFKEIKEIIKLHWQLYPKSIKKDLYIFIDEPQNINNWEIAARALHDDSFNVYLSGSSSKLLSKDIATSLRGRTISFIVLPFSFREFLKMKNMDFDIKRIGSKEKSILLNLLDEYLEYGGFPEVIEEQNLETKLKIINEYFDLIVYKDVVERYKIKNTQLIKWLIKALTASFSKEFSVHKLYSILKSKGLKLSKNTLYSYLTMLEDSMFVFFAPKFKHSIRKRELLINKAYLADLGFAKLAETSKDKGKKMENAVFLELKRKPSYEIFYWSNGKEEVDFVIKNGKIKQLIQVCYDIDDYETKKREIKAILKASRELKCGNLLVITGDKEDKEKINGKTVKYIPLLKWLLLNKSNKSLE